MDIVPKLNLTDNYKDVDNMSLVGARNIMLDKNGILTFDKGVEENEVINNAIKSYFGEDSYVIIYCIPCNKELVIFVKNASISRNKIQIFRYNEDKNECKLVIENFEYNNGTLIGDFTYNKSDLIIIVSEHSNYNDKKIPLRTINLGDFDKENFVDEINEKQLKDSRLHPICPEVIIPNVNTDIIPGHANKGWYFIFIRYKISNNTYTQWFSTNESVYLDSFKNTGISKYYMSNWWNDGDDRDDGFINSSQIRMNISDMTNISEYTCKIELTNLDEKYNEYQIGLINVSKGETKAFRSEDINCINNSIIFDNFINHDVKDLLIIYNNYYNVKTLTNHKNKIYIGNYKEFEKVLDVSKIKVKLGLFKKDIYDNIKNTDYELLSTNYLNNINTISPLSISANGNISILEDGIGTRKNLDYKDENDRLYIEDIVGKELEKDKYTSGFIHPDDIDNVEYDILTTEEGLNIKAVKGPLSFVHNTNRELYTKSFSQDIHITRKIPYFTNKEKVFIIIPLILSYFEQGKTEPTEAHNTYLVYAANANNLRVLVNYELKYNNGKYEYVPIVGSTAKSVCIINGNSAEAPWLKFDKSNESDDYGNLKSHGIKIGDNIYNVDVNLFFDSNNFEYRNWLGISYSDDYLLGSFNANLSWTEGNENADLLNTKHYGFRILTGANFTMVPLKDLDNNVKGFYDLQTVLQEIYDTPDYLINDDSIVRFTNYNIANRLPLTLTTFARAWFWDFFGSMFGLEEPEPNPDNPEEDVPVQPNKPNPNIPINNPTLGRYDYNVASCLSPGLSLNEYYSFYVHFVNKYGEITKGYQIKEFDGVELIPIIPKHGETLMTNGVDYELIQKNTNDKLIINFKTDNDYIDYDVIDETRKYKYYIKLSLSELPDDYIGYFISSEKLDKSLIYSGIAYVPVGFNESKVLKFKCDKLNYDDVIDYSFDTIYLREFQKLPVKEDDMAVNRLTVESTNTTLYKFKIKQKKIFVADEINNMNYDTYLEIEIEDNEHIDIFNDTDKRYFATLINTKDDYKYLKETATLIPCSQINYNINSNIEVNPKSVFVSNIFNIEYFGYIYDTGINVFRSGTIKNDGDNNIIEGTIYQNNPYELNLLSYKDYVINESVSFNNKPNGIVFTIKGFETTNDKNKQFLTGSVVEAKNSIDLFQQKQLSYDNANPIIFNSYNKDIINTDEYHNTIRRSNIIQDESNENAWRKFYIEQYKNITENKGEIIKIFGLDDRLYIHTKHSLFLFDSTDTIASDKNGIQLQSIDTWETKYKEMFPTKLGFGGINKEDNGIVGMFGYVWFDAGEQAFYRIDEQNKFEKISVNIEKHIKLLDIIDVTFIDDKENMRLIILLKNYLYRRGVDTISYNYGINAFISTHHYSFDFGASTKNGCYIISGNIYNYTDNKDINKLPIINRYINKISNNYRFIDIIYNANYNIIKYLDSIKFNIISIVNKKINDEFNTIEKEIHKTMTNDYIKIFNEYCDTGILDIANGDDFINEISDYTKPVFMLGNWHFNYIRNNLANYETNGNINNDDVSRFYGRYFIVRFIYSNIVVDAEFNSIDFNLINDN